MNTQFIHTPRALVVYLVATISMCAVSHVAAQVQSTKTLSTSSDYVCVQRGPHSKIWQRSVVSTNAAGIVRTNLHSYTELATGLCYLQNGQYVDSVEQIVPVADGAEATQGRHRVHWAANANTPGGAITLTTPDDKQLRSTVFGLLYYDSSTGSNVLLGQLQDSTATIAADNANTLIYANAFSNITADIRYTYRKAGMSQDIILKQRPPSPVDYGMNPDTCWLQVLTEFFDPPEPARRTEVNRDIRDDIQLDFGDMRMGIGHAFLFQNDAQTQDGGMVTKQWTNIDGRTFLIEEVLYNSISNLLESLHSSTIKPDRSKVRRTVMLENRGRAGAPTPAVLPNHPQSVKTAKSTPRETGLVLDYEILGGSTNNLTLQGDTTYLISGLVQVANILTVEGGTVVKYTNFMFDNPLMYFSNIVCLTAPYRPAVFTTMNDDSVGDPIRACFENAKPSIISKLLMLYNIRLVS